MVKLEYNYQKQRLDLLSWNWLKLSEYVVDILARLEYDFDEKCNQEFSQKNNKSCHVCYSAKFKFNLKVR